MIKPIFMGKFNMKNEWDFVIYEINHKQETKNLFVGELLFAAQILLNKIADAKDKSRRILLKNIYVRLKNQYLDSK